VGGFLSEGETTLTTEVDALYLQARGRAGTITHASPEKAAAKTYDSKDDM
jgi:hypothetical protein